MSKNLDLVRSIYADWERGDWSSSQWADPDIEYAMVDEPGSQGRRGVGAVTDAWRTFLSAWDGYRIEADEYRILDEERILVLVRPSGRGKSSGLELRDATRGRKGANVFHIRDGKVTRLDAYIDHRRALADLGLAPEQEHAGRTAN
jgi:ketosteroid isomerase-like protein